MKKVIDFIKKYIDIIIKYIKLFINKIVNFIKMIKDKIYNYLKKRKEEKKQSKIKIFFIGVFGYIGSVFSYLISKPKEKKEVDINSELKKINKNILNIEKSIENETTPLVLKMYKKEVNKKIDKLKNIKNIKTREETKLVKEEEEVLLNIKEKINNCEKKLKNINYEEKVKEIKKEDKEINIINEEENFIEQKTTIPDVSKKDIVVSTIKNTTNKVISNTKKEIKKTSNNIKKGALITSTAVAGLVTNIIPKKEKLNEEKEQRKEIKKENYLINEVEDKKLKEKIKELNNKINKTYNEINYDEFELNRLKEKVKDLKEEYIKLTKNEKFKDLKNYKNIYEIDPNHLVYHDKAIDNLIEYLEKQITDVKNNKIEIKKEELKKEELKKEKKEFDFDNSDIMLAKESIKKDIKLSMEDIKKIKVDMNSIPKKYKKTNLITKLSNFFKYSINVGISLIPFGIFKNKLLATLTSGIILNNRIRSMNSIVNNDEKVNFIQYESILTSLNNRKSCLENTNYVLLDTVSQIDSLISKLELMEVNDIEKDKLLIGLDEMKLDLLEENLKIETMLENMNNINKNKIKMKVS